MELAPTSEREQARPKVKADGYKFVGEPNPNPENKQLLIIPDASHCDLYDGGEKSNIPFDKLEEFFRENMK